MARFKNGFFSGFSGAVGPVESYQLNGQLIIRSRRTNPTRPPTDRQLACRATMKLTSTVLGAFPAVVKAGFAGVAERQAYNAYNAAVAYNMQNAITGSFPELNIDYGRIRITQGNLSVVGINASAFLQNNAVKFLWEPSIVYPRSTDHAMLLAYAPSLKQAIYNLCGAKRRNAEDTLKLPDNWIGVRLHTYLAFKAETINECTNSIYLGEL
jgi:hypothetical protein